MPNTFGSNFDIHILGFLPDFPINPYFTSIPIDVWQLKLKWVLTLLNLELLKWRPRWSQSTCYLPTLLVIMWRIGNCKMEAQINPYQTFALLGPYIRNIDATDFNMKKIMRKLIQYYMVINFQLDLLIFLQYLWFAHILMNIYLYYIFMFLLS